MQQGMKTLSHILWWGTHSHLRSLWWPSISSQLLSKIRGTSQFIGYLLKTDVGLETQGLCACMGMHGLGGERGFISGSMAYEEPGGLWRLKQVTHVALFHAEACQWDKSTTADLLHCMSEWCLLPPYAKTRCLLQFENGKHSEFFHVLDLTKIVIGPDS